MNANPIDILLIEDNAEDVELAMEALSQGKVLNRISTIDNGEDAVQYLKQQGRFGDCRRPDVILLDLNLPRKDGWEVLKEIRNDKSLSNIPVIILTVSQLTEEQRSEHGHMDFVYIRKSSNFLPFIDTIRKLQQKVYDRIKSESPVVKSKEIKILLVEDNVADAELLGEILYMKEKNNWLIKHVESMQAAMDCLESQSFDIILLDLMLPDSQGLETLRWIVNHKSFMPIVVITGLKDEQVSLEALREGAQDYLVKGQINSELFIRTVQYSIERKHMDLMRDEIIGYVNHELNNPLSIIKESVSQVSDGILGPVNERQKKNLDSALYNIDRMVHITDDLLDSTRLAFDKILLEKSPVNVVEVAQSAMESIQAKAEKKGLILSWQSSSEVLMANIDRDRISQVFINLLGNAIKFTPSGRIEIAVAERGELIECRVIDTGIGIPADKIPQLFQRFERVELKNNMNIKGTGLGLYICKKLIELHAGQIRVESVLGAGTKFIFTIPRENKTLGERL